MTTLELDEHQAEWLRRVLDSLVAQARGGATHQMLVYVAADAYGSIQSGTWQERFIADAMAVRGALGAPS